MLKLILSNTKPNPNLFNFGLYMCDIMCYTFYCYLQAHKTIIEERELEARIRRAQLAREKSEKVVSLLRNWF